MLSIECITFKLLLISISISIDFIIFKLFMHIIKSMVIETLKQFTFIFFFNTLKIYFFYKLKILKIIDVNYKAYKRYFRLDCSILKLKLETMINKQYLWFY